MKSTLYAVIVACLAMLATSGILALATAAPAPASPSPAEHELVAHLDLVLEAQLQRIKLEVQSAPHLVPALAANDRPSDLQHERLGSNIVEGP